jgi:hypothetical protein
MKEPLPPSQAGTRTRRRWVVKVASGQSSALINQMTLSQEGGEVTRIESLDKEEAAKG